MREVMAIIWYFIYSEMILVFFVRRSGALGQTQEFTLDQAWECPDLREIPIESGGTKWVFISADGFYFLGDFDGYQFETDGVRKMPIRPHFPMQRKLFGGQMILS